MTDNLPPNPAAIFFILARPPGPAPATPTRLPRPVPVSRGTRPVPSRSLPDPVPGIRDGAGSGRYGAGSGRGEAGAGWRALLIIAALITAVIWTLVIGRLLSPDDTFRFPRKTQHLPETPAPIPPLPALNDVAQRLPGTAWRVEG